MPSEFESIFARLRSVLQKHSGTLSVGEATSKAYSLTGRPGPATLKAWGGKIRKAMIPVAWVQIGKAYVSYHLMGIDGNAKLCNAMSAQLKSHMQGKTCFNFKEADNELFVELDRLTSASITGLRSAGYIA